MGTIGRGETQLLMLMSKSDNPADTLGDGGGDGGVSAYVPDKDRLGAVCAFSQEVLKSILCKCAAAAPWDIEEFSFEVLHFKKHNEGPRRRFAIELGEPKHVAQISFKVSRKAPVLSGCKDVRDCKLPFGLRWFPEVHAHRKDQHVETDDAQHQAEARLSDDEDAKHHTDEAARKAEEEDRGDEADLDHGHCVEEMAPEGLEELSSDDDDALPILPGIYSYDPQPSTHAAKCVICNETIAPGQRRWHIRTRDGLFIRRFAHGACPLKAAFPMRWVEGSVLQLLTLVGKAGVHETMPPISDVSAHLLSRLTHGA